MPQFDLAKLMQMLPAIEQIALGGALLGGLFMWLFGRKLARPASAALGLAVGGIVAVSLPGAIENRSMLPLFVVTGCVVGFCLSWMMFRPVVGLCCALLLAAAVPTSMMIRNDSTPPWVLLDPIELSDAPPASGQPEPDATSPQGDDAAQAARDMLLVLQHEVESRVRRQAEAVRAWWDHLEPAGRKSLIAQTLAGAVAGLFVGLIAPYFTISVASSLIGAIMMLIGGVGLYMTNQPADAERFTWTSRQATTAIGLITAMGIALQWIIWRRKADK